MIDMVTSLTGVGLLGGAAAVSAGLGAAWAARRRGLDLWLPAYLSQAPRPALPAGQPVHLLLCIGDHYEPKLGGAGPEQARRRVDTWVTQYPRLCREFADSDGRPPRHSFFYPEEEYEPEFLEALAGLCGQGLGEVEIHLHHDNDTADNLRRTLTRFKELLHERHGCLGRDRRTDDIVYGFIHGNWALDNSLPSGRWCGVNNELDVLRETGCYADFTLPSAPSRAQTRIINSIYYAVDDPCRPKSHDTGVPLGTAPKPADSLMLIQGPLGLDWSRRKWGVVPRVENACLQGSQPPTADRVDAWLRAGVRVAVRPDWFFVKLHTHGADERNHRALLGEPMAEFHRALAARAQRDPLFRYHYVTAREMYNLARAAEAGWAGSVAEARDFEVSPPPAAGPAPPAGGAGSPPARATARPD